MTRIVLVGAGSLQFGSGMLGDIFTSHYLKGCDIILNDINEEAAKRTCALGQDYINTHRLPHTVRVETNLETALKNADFVVIYIEVGDRFALWDMDWRVPQQYGIPQIYGENGGPGGLFHSLRIIPPILKIVEQVMETCPQATIFNFSNPMSRIATTVNRAYPEAKFIGLCHEIVSLERHLPQILDRPRDSFSYTAGGLNHFSVLADITDCDGTDLYPLVREKAPAYFEKQTGYSDLLAYTRKHGVMFTTEGWDSLKLEQLPPSRPWSDRTLFQFFLNHFHMLPITYDSHFGEYIHWADEISDHRGIVDFYTLYRHFLGNAEVTITTQRKEKAVPMMEAILGGPAYEEVAVNIPNNGYIEDLPTWICVEVPAWVDTKGVHGKPVPLTAGVRSLLTNQIGIHNMTSLAVLEKSKELAIQALLCDPITRSAQNIPQLLDHMITEQGPWLDYLR